MIAFGNDQRDTAPLDRIAILVAVVAIAVAVTFTWILPLPSSFWLDETSTIWAVRGSLGEALARASAVPGQQSPVFSFVTWMAIHAMHPIEVAARLPSVVGVALAAFGVHRLAHRDAGALPALVAVATFVTVKTVAFAAADARPYALALAAVVWTMVALRRWADTEHVAAGIAAAALAAVAFNLHYTSAVLLPLYAWWVIGARIRARQALAAVIVFLVMAAPSFAQVASLWSARAAHSFTSSPSSDDLVVALAYPRLFAAIVAGALLASVVVPSWTWSREAMRRRWVGALAGWAILPAVTLFLIAVLTDAKLFVARYYLWATPGVALLAAAWVASIHAAAARRIVALVIIVAVCVRQPRVGSAAHGGEDWRGAIAAIVATGHDAAPLLVQSGLTEARDGPAVDPAPADHELLTPLTAYPGISRAWIVPSTVDSAAHRRLSALADARLDTARQVFFLGRAGDDATPAWLDGRLGARGFASRELGGFGGLRAIAWERTPSRP